MAIYRAKVSKVEESSFLKDIDVCLSSNEKRISSKYFYDARGSRIFQKIMDMPSYYLTRCELEILTTHAQKIYKALQFEEPFNIIELGVGDGKKTVHLLKHLLESHADFTYIPIDISFEAIDQLTSFLAKEIPLLSIHPEVGDYHVILDGHLKMDKYPTLLLFLGSNIGNYTKDDALNLLHLFRDAIKPNDKLLLGADLQKNPITIRNAYDDSEHITKSFNFNLLHRMKYELGANINVDDFDYYCYYNPYNGEVRSYLVSLKPQDIFVEALSKTFHLEKDELILTEISKKYTTEEMDDLAYQVGFKVLSYFMDKKGYFTDSLWVK